MKLDKYEKEINNSIERGEWKSIKHLGSEKKRLMKVAKTTLLKNRTMNIKIAENDVYSLKEKATEQGATLQTFITSILHKYAIGKLKEKWL